MIVNEALVDYVSFSSFDMNSMTRFWDLSPIDKFATKGGETVEQKRMQYQGLSVYAFGGSWFIGWGTQKGETHALVQVSGQAAEYALKLAKDDIVSGKLTVTRIDVQRTISEPEGWDSGELIIECESKGLKPRVARSPGLGGKELITVYTGTRASGRMNRTYQKETMDGERFVRFETEFGRHYAKAVAHRILTGKETRQDFVNGEVLRRDKVGMFEVFKAGDGAYEKIPNEKREAGKTERWIIQLVLPALVKYKNRHDSNPRLIETIIDELSREDTHEQE